MEVDGISVAAAEAIRDASVVSGAVNPATGHLILTTAGGTASDAGKVTPEIYLKRKAGVTNRVSTTVATDDPDLIQALAANGIYEVLASLQFSGGAGGSKIQFAAPQSTSIDLDAVHGQNSAAANGNMWMNTTSPTPSVSNAGTTLVYRARLIVIMGATPGNFSVQWAQMTSNAASTTLMAGSNLVIRRII